MRAPIIGLFYASESDAAVGAARVSARVTHAHPLGIEGAVMMATAVLRALHTRNSDDVFDFAALRCRQAAFVDRIAVARRWLQDRKPREPGEVVKKLGHGISATGSCVTGLCLGARFLSDSFLDLQSFVAHCGGDADTIGAMSGAIWGAANGASHLPEAELQKLEQKERLEGIAAALYRVHVGRLSRGNPPP